MSWSIDFKPRKKQLSGDFNVYCDGNLIINTNISASAGGDTLDVLNFGEDDDTDVSLTTIKNFIDSIDNDIRNHLILDGMDGGTDILYENKVLRFSVCHYTCSIDFKLHINTPELKAQVITAFEKFLEHFTNQYKKTGEYKELLKYKQTDEYKNSDEYKKSLEKYSDEYVKTDEYKRQLETYIESKN